MLMEPSAGDWHLIETRPEVFRSEIERMNRAADETQKRWQSDQFIHNVNDRAEPYDPPTDVTLRISDDGDAGKHRHRRRSA